MSLRSCPGRIVGILALLLMMAAPSSACIQRASDPGTAAIHWLQRRQHEIHADPAESGGRAPYTLFDLTELGTDTLRVLRKYGETAEALSVLARCREWRGRFTEAQASYQRALQLHPDSKQLLAGFRRTREFANIARIALPRPQGSRAIVQVSRLRTKHHPRMWAALSVKIDEKEHVLDAPVLHLVRERDGRRLVTSRAVGLWCPEDVSLVSADFTRRGRPELAITGCDSGAGWAPSEVVVFDCSGGRFRKLWDAESNDPVLFEDLGHNGGVEMGLTHEIGKFLGHAAQPRWTDYYARRRGRFVEVNAAFPRHFRPWISDLYNALHEARREDDTTPPSVPDPEILDYLGRTQEIEGKPRATRSAYRRSLCSWQRLAMNSKWWTQQAEKAIPRLRAHLRQLDKRTGARR